MISKIYNLISFHRIPRSCSITQNLSAVHKTKPQNICMKFRDLSGRGRWVARNESGGGDNEHQCH